MNISLAAESASTRAICVFVQPVYAPSLVKLSSLLRLTSLRPIASAVVAERAHSAERAFERLLFNP